MTCARLEPWLSGKGVKLVGVGVVVVLFALLIGVTGSVAAQSAPNCSNVSYDGAGTSSNPYEVGVVEQLQCIEEKGLSANYTQVADIDASGTSMWNNGDGFDPIGNFSDKFTGTFDGAGHTVSELTIDRGSARRVGMFGSMAGQGRIKNVSLENIDITGNNEVGGLVGDTRGGTVTESYATGRVSGDNRVGGLVGFNLGTITKSYATVGVSGSGFDVGGLVGINFAGTVERSYATGDISGTGDFVGGLVGRNAGNGEITDAYARGNVTGSQDVGGVVGQNGDPTVAGNAEVARTYATGVVSGTANVSGLVGFNRDGTVENSYWDEVATGQTDAVGASSPDGSESNLVGFSSDSDGDNRADEMIGTAALTNMNAFDFTSTWETVTNPDDYPVLAWQGDTQLFTQPLIDRFSAPPTNIPKNNGGFDDTLYEDLDGDGIGIDVTQTVAVFGELIRGNDLNGDAPDGGLTDDQARALNWNQGSPDTEVTPSDMVSLFGEQIRAD